MEIFVGFNAVVFCSVLMLQKCELVVLEGALGVSWGSAGCSAPVSIALQLGLLCPAQLRVPGRNLCNQAFPTVSAGNRPSIGTAARTWEELHALDAVPFMLSFYAIFFSLMQINLKL